MAACSGQRAATFSWWNTVRTRVKICGITREVDGIAAAEAGADAIGLVFWAGTPRCVSTALARRIAAAVPPFVSIVGLFVDPDAHEVRTVLEQVPIDVLQFHGNESPQLCGSFGRPYIKAVPVRPGVDLLQYAARYEEARGLLFDAFEPGGLPGGTGTTFDWKAIPRSLRRPLMLSGGLNAQNVALAIRTAAPWAVDVSSGVEVSGEDGRPRRGLKDPAKMAAFIREVHDADVRSP
jgi:phosphoribosylanthranilate isomerase